MGNRPGTLAKIEKGKSIYSVVGFADTWNWLVACMANMKAGRGLKLKWPADDTPEFSLDKEDDGDGGGGGGTTVAFTGTDQSQTARGTDFIFSSATDSNVVVTCDDDVITLGVYYT